MFFLEFSCLFYDTMDVGNLISGSSAFSKSSSYTWRFLVHVLLKLSLENFEHLLTSMWNECNCAVVWTTIEIVESISSVQPFSCVWLFVTLWTAAHQASLSLTISWSLLKLTSIKLVMPSNHFILFHPLLLPPSIFASIMLFSNESVLRIRWPKYWSFSFSRSPSNEYSRLISFRIDWLDLLAVPGILKSLFQHHSSKASIICHSASFIFSTFNIKMLSIKIIVKYTSKFRGSRYNLRYNFGDL